jgi:hypothetical protein
MMLAGTGAKRPVTGFSGHSPDGLVSLTGKHREGSGSSWGSLVVGAEVVIGYLFAWAVRKARRAGERADGQVDAALDAGVDRAGQKLRELVAGRPGGDAALERLATDAEQGLQAPSSITAQWLEALLNDAAQRDERFAAAVDALVGQLQAARPDVTASAPGGVAVAGTQQISAASGGVSAGVLHGGAHVGNPPVPGPPRQ